MFSEGRSPLKVTMCVWVSYVKCILTGWGGQEIVHVVWGGHCAPQKTVTLSNSYEIYVLSGGAWPPRQKKLCIFNGGRAPQGRNIRRSISHENYIFSWGGGPPLGKNKINL